MGWLAASCNERRSFPTLDTLSVLAAIERDTSMAVITDGCVENRCLRFCNTREDYEKVGEEPKVVLASHSSLQTGFARQLAIEWIEDKKNGILLTTPPEVIHLLYGIDIDPDALRSQAGSLAHVLLERAATKSTEKIDVTLSRRYDRPSTGIGPSSDAWLCVRRVALTGEELEAYEAEKEKQRNAVVSDNNGPFAMCCSLWTILMSMCSEMDVDARSQGSSPSMDLNDGNGQEKQGVHGQNADTLSKSTRMAKQLSRTHTHRSSSL